MRQKIVVKQKLKKITTQKIEHTPGWRILLREVIISLRSYLGSLGV